MPIVRYRIVSALRKGVTIVARQASQRLDWQSKHVADAALCLDDLRRTRIEFQLPPQSQDLHVDAAVKNVFMHPRCLQQIFAAERPLGCV